MSEYRALCGYRGTCIVCGEVATDTHMNQAHAAPNIAKAIKDYQDGLRRGDEDTSIFDGYHKPLKEEVLANIAKVSPAFVIGYRKSMQITQAEILRAEADIARHLDRDWYDH